MSSFKINPDVKERFFLLTIDNKYAKHMPILQFLLKASAGSIGIPSYFCRWEVENSDGNIENNKSELEIGTVIEVEIN